MYSPLSHPSLSRSNTGPTALTARPVETLRHLLEREHFTPVRQRVAHEPEEVAQRLGAGTPPRRTTSAARRGFFRLEIFDLSRSRSSGMCERGPLPSEPVEEQQVLGVEEIHSSTRTTCVISIRWSSTTTARWYVGNPSALRITWSSGRGALTLATNQIDERQRWVVGHQHPPRPGVSLKPGSVARSSRDLPVTQPS